MNPKQPVIKLRVMSRLSNHRRWQPRKNSELVVK